MPTSIPKIIFLGHLKNMLCSIFKLSIRACLVCFIWLGLVPFITVWICRFYFWNADTTNQQENQNQTIPNQIINQIDENLQPEQQHEDIVNVPRNQENENIDNVANGGAGGPEDIDGILEAIGMKGSIYMLFQNSGLMTLLMSLCLGVGIWLPYILGVFFITVSFLFVCMID